MDLGIPGDSVQRDKSIGLWFEGDALRVRAELRDQFREPDGTAMALHHYRIELDVERATLVVRDAVATPLALPYDGCLAAAPNLARLVGLRLVAGFTDEARQRLAGEAGCTHLTSLVSDLSIAGLFQGYIAVRDYERQHGALPKIPASASRTGVCAGWAAGGPVAIAMETGAGIAPTHIYPSSVAQESR